MLRPSELHTTCPFKGEASYHSLEIDGTTHSDVVWYYPDPIPEVARIAGMMSFYPDRARIEVDGSAVLNRLLELKAHRCRTTPRS